MIQYLGVVKVVFLSASCLPGNFTEAAGVHVSQHEGLSSVGNQEAILIHVDALHLMLIPGLQDNASACNSSSKEMGCDISA